MVHCFPKPPHTVGFLGTKTYSPCEWDPKDTSLTLGILGTKTYSPCAWDPKDTSLTMCVHAVHTYYSPKTALVFTTTPMSLYTCPRKHPLSLHAIVTPYLRIATCLGTYPPPLSQSRTWHVSSIFVMVSSSLSPMRNVVLKTMELQELFLGKKY